MAQSSWKAETRARRCAALAMAAVAGLAAQVWSGVAALSLLIAAVLFIAIEFGWVLFAFEVSPEYKATRSKDQTALIGVRGVSKTACAPMGRIEINGESWQAQVEDGTTIPAGEEVVVTRSDSLVLTVARR